MCPWCAIGQARLMQALKIAGADVEPVIRWMPFELNPDAPAQGKPQAEHLAQVYGRSAEEVAAMGENVAAAAREAGWPIDYAGSADPAPQAMMWNTFAAHCLLRWALTVEGPEAQTRLKLALFAAHFRERRNISDKSVLADIAATCGLDRDAAAAALDDEALAMAVRHEEQRGLQSGIKAVPSFVVAGRYILEGASEPEQFARALTQIAAMEAAA